MVFKKLVLIDGLSRSGKNAFVDLITSLKNSENIEMNYVFEHIVEGMSLKLIDKKFVKNFFFKFLNEIAYNKFLSRNSNFRKSDKSSVQNFSFPNLYFKRLREKDGNHIFKKLKKTKNFFPFMTHEILTNIDYFDSLNLNYKMISVLRNPFDIVYSWYKKKVIKNKKNFTLTFSYKEKYFPWYVYNDHKKWLGLNEIDKIAFIVEKLIKNSIQKFKKIKDKNKFIFVTYEQHVEKPHFVLKKICRFLKTNYSSQTKRKIKLANLPIKIDEDLRKSKIIFLKKNLSPYLFNKIQRLEKSYNKNLYGFNKNKLR